MLADARKEWRIRRVLRKLSKQRLALILQPGNVWVVERAVEDNVFTDMALKTCFLRGWAEPLENAIPTGNLTPDGKLPNAQIFDRVKPLYRLTDSGWNVVHRSQLWVMVSLFLALLGLIGVSHR